MGVLLVLFFITAAIVAFFMFDFEKLDKNNAYVSKAINIKSAAFEFLWNKTGISFFNKNTIKMDSLNCRIKPTIHRDGNDMCDAFSVEVCGLINIPKE